MVNADTIEARDVVEKGTNPRAVRTRKVRAVRKRHRIRARRNTSKVNYLLTPLGVFEAVAIEGPIYIKTPKRGKVSHNLVFKA